MSRHAAALPFSLAFVLLLAVAMPAVAQSQDYLAMPLPQLKSALQAGKQVLVARQLGLDQAEEASFWPVYDEVQRSLAAIAERRAGAIAAIRAGGEGARDAAEVLVEAEVDQAEALERAWNRLRRAIPAEKLGRYLLLERRIAAAEQL